MKSKLFITLKSPHEFGGLELVSRIRAVMRRSTIKEDARVLVAGGIEMDLDRHTVHSDGKIVTLTNKEFELLKRLLGSPEMVFSRDLLREQVWGPDWFGDDHVVDVHVANLRRKIDRKEGPSFLRTVRGVGYIIAAGDG
mgnify:CR=1 FL=1